VTEEIQIPTLPDVKIVRDGKPVDTSAIDDYDSFMSFLMLASIASQAVKIRRYVEDRTSIGREQNFELNITPAVQEIILAYPSQSLYIKNDGPGQIYVEINLPGYGATRLLANDKKEVNFETHKLKQFNVWSAPGTIASARAVVKF
jgi:hypothetical protein